MKKIKRANKGKSTYKIFSSGGYYYVSGHSPRHGHIQGIYLTKKSAIYGKKIEEQKDKAYASR